MVVKLRRYYGDGQVTKSVVAVFMEGEREPRLVCEAREPRFRDYEVTFPGASRCCLPRGRWRMRAGCSEWGTMTLRVVRCPGHRCVPLCWDLYRQAMEGRVLLGVPQPVGGESEGEGSGDVWRMDDEERRERRIERGDEVYGRLEKLVYEAFGRGEEFSIEITNEA